MYPQQRCAENSSGGDVTKPLEVFAERRLRRGSDTETEDILVQFGPVMRQDGAAFCRYTVSGVDGSLTRDIWGIDGVQAVQLAMAMVGADLDRLANGGKYSVADDSHSESGHGFPSIT
jgi:hypothetical protein